MSNKRELDYELTRIFNKLQETQADFEIAFEERHEGVAHTNYTQGIRNLEQLQKMILDLKQKR
jgi:hypothetical protein